MHMHILIIGFESGQNCEFENALVKPRLVRSTSQFLIKTDLILRL